MKGPFTDPFVHRPYNRDSIEERVFNKLWMQDSYGLYLGEHIPVFGWTGETMPPEVSEALYRMLPEFLAQGAQVLVCAGGTEGLQPLKIRFPKQVALMPYSREGVSEVYSSVDIFLTDTEKDGKAAGAYGAVPVALHREALIKALRDYEDAEGWERMQKEGM